MKSTTPRKTQKQTLNYRPDIDGIRAIAVISVILYHVKSDYLPGGFVGVDVFFVLSGFLITGIVSTEISNGYFSIVNFYERRCRRIFPALIAMTIATFIAAYCLFLPEAFKEFGQSVAALGLFSTNFLFFFEHGYFDGPSELKPLLHTWSLSVEEQFYIVFPLVLVILASLSKRRTIAILVVVLMISLYLNIITTYTQAQFAFYMPFTRAWELLAGGILAITTFKLSNRLILNALGAFGAVLLVFSFFQINAEVAFPGWAAIAPVLGTVLLLVSGSSSSSQSFVNRSLSAPPIVHIGKLSYSLYLIHWPLIVFIQYYLMRELNLVEILAYILGCLALAQLSYSFIENPFRKRNFLQKRTIFTLTILFLISFVFIGAILHKTYGLPGRYDAQVVNLSKGEKNPWRQDCLSKSISDIADGNYCVHGNKENIEIALVGDSHADAMVPAILQQLDLKETGIAIFTMRGCRPFQSYERVTAKRAVEVPVSSTKMMDIPDGFLSGCGRFMTEAYKQIDLLGINHIVLHARWTLQYFGDQTDKPTLCFADKALPYCSTDNNETVFKKYYRHTLNQLDQYKVLVIGPVPEHIFEVPDALGRSEIFGRELVFDRLYTNRGKAVLQSMMASTEIMENVQYFSPYSILCTYNNQLCKIQEAGRSLYNDASHLSYSGSLELGEGLREVFLDFFDKN